MARVMKGSRRTTEGVGLADDTDLGEIHRGSINVHCPKTDSESFHL